MAKIGKKPVVVPEGVVIEIQPGKIGVKGGKGTLTLNLPEGIKVVRQESELLVTKEGEGKTLAALQGTIRQLLANMIAGQTKEWEKKLKIVGTGYGASLSGNELVLNLGLANQVKVAAPEGIRFQVEKDIVSVLGADKEKVGQMAAYIRKLRPADPYKGKGIRYEGEEIKLKPGKAAKAGEGAAAK